MSYFEDDKKGQRNQAFPRPLYYYPLSFACLCDISCDTCMENIGDMGGGVLSCFLSLHPQTTKKPPKHWIFQHLRGFFKVELRGIESLKNSSIYQRFRAACDISCDTYMILNCLKCSLIFLFCRAVSRSITFLYTAFITLSEAQPPRWSMY